jgi:hypothetical protein
VRASGLVGAPESHIAVQSLHGLASDVDHALAPALAHHADDPRIRVEVVDRLVAGRPAEVGDLRESGTGPDEYAHQRHVPAFREALPLAGGQDGWAPALQQVLDEGLDVLPADAGQVGRHRAVIEEGGQAPDRVQIGADRVRGEVRCAKVARPARDVDGWVSPW